MSARTEHAGLNERDRKGWTAANKLRYHTEHAMAEQTYSVAS